MGKILFRLMTPILLFLLVVCTEDKIIPSEVIDGPEPQASFTYSQNFLEVTFQSTSNHAESYYWEFGDGATSTESSPVHTYAASGTYEVVLKVNSVAGYSSLSEKASIYVAGAAVPFYTYTSVSDLEFIFDASKSSNVKSVKWDFGDGSPDENDLIITHEFPDFGIYQVKLYVTGLLDDIAELDLPITVGGPVTPVFNHYTRLGLDVFFDASHSENVKSVKWNFGDGSPEEEGLIITHTFPANGTFLVKMTATGVLNDVEELIIPVEVVENYNLLKGSGMETEDEVHWQSYSYGGTTPLDITFGYTVDKPNGGEGACVAFSGGNGSTRTYIYQAVEVEEGKQYRLSGQVKFPAGSTCIYIRMAIATSINISGQMTPVVFETSHESSRWSNPTTLYDDDLQGSIFSGTLSYTGSQGIWTSNRTGTVYVGFSVYSCSTPQAPVLYDEIKFELIPE